MIFTHAEEETRKEQEEKRKECEAEERARIDKLRQFYFGPKSGNDNTGDWPLVA